MSIAVDRLGFLVEHLLSVKGPCRVATVGPITLSGTQTIDGVAVVADDRVLVKDQTDGLNAIYVCQSGEWELAEDCDQRGHIIKGSLVLVTDGDTNPVTQWHVTTTGTPRPGRQPITFERLGATFSTMSFADGSAADPSLAFTNDEDVGLFLAASNTLGIAVGGASAVEFAGASTGLSISSDERGFWINDGVGANVWRLADRVFVGEAVNASGTDFNASQDSILPTAAEGANWALRDSQLLSIAGTGLIAVTGISRSSDQNSTPTESIGVAGFVVNDKAGGIGWGLYSDVQHESGAEWSAGLEIAAKNKDADVIPNSYSIPNGVYGVWLPGGGDNAYGGTAANPNAAAIVIKKNAHTWNAGIVFASDGLTGDDGVTGTGIALEMAKGHIIRWTKSGGATGAQIRSDVVTTDADVSQLFSDRMIAWYGDNDKEIFSALHTSSGVNNVRVTNATSGNSPSIAARGDGTDIGLILDAKGAEFIRFADAAVPNVSDGVALGSTALMWSDLFLASGSVVNFNAGDVTITHSSSALAFAGASAGYSFDAIVTGTDATLSGGLRVGFAGTPTSDRLEVADANFYLDGPSTSTDPIINFDSGGDVLTYIRASNEFRFRIANASAFILSAGLISPPSNGGVALGTTALSFSSLSLTSGGAVNWGGSVRVTHSANALDVTGVSSGVTFDGGITAFSTTPASSGGTAGRGIKLSNATNFGIFYGSSAPTLQAAQGSLYLRTDGTSTNTRMYINTNSSAVWTAVHTST